jgi:four helix bundle protein
MGRFHGDLPERTYEFARAITRMVRQIPAGTEGWTIGKQLLRCGTSVGANVSEADAALTEAEFASICNIARRESLETRFWLRLVKDESILPEPIVQPALQEAEEIGRILTTIVRRTRGE